MDYYQLQAPAIIINQLKVELRVHLTIDCLGLDFPIDMSLQHHLHIFSKQYF